MRRNPDILRLLGRILHLLAMHHIVTTSRDLCRICRRWLSNLLPRPCSMHLSTQYCILYELMVLILHKQSIRIDRISSQSQGCEFLMQIEVKLYIIVT